MAERSRTDERLSSSPCATLVVSVAEVGLVIVTTSFAQ
jgi:hypothetical protein